MKKLLYMISLMLCFHLGIAKEWILSDQNLKVIFDDQTQIVKVLDKRCNKVWEQLPFGNGFSVSKVSQKNNLLTINLKGSYQSTCTIELDLQSELIYSIVADSKVTTERFSFPAAIKTPDNDHFLLQTDGQGMLLPVDDKEYPLGNGRTFYCGGGLSMSWMGMVDKEFNTGYMVILETPYDAALETFRDNGLITFRPVWMPSLGQFGYKRVARYVFFDRGGYVAQAKKYREYIWPKNKVVSLKENQKRFPAIEKMLGAVHIYVWDKAREAAFVQQLNNAGIEKALFLWNPNHAPYPDPDFYKCLKDLNYGYGGYELYSDIDPRDSIVREDNSPLFLRRKNYPGRFHDIAIREKGNKFHVNQFGHTTCPEAIRPDLIKRSEKEMAIYPHETYFVDVYHANGLFECYHPKHQLTRQQFAEAVIKNLSYLEDKYNTYIGAEWGADFAGTHGFYAHGMMTLQRTWFGSDIQKRGTIYYYGNWRNNSRPTQMLTTRVAPDTYHKFSINEYTRVPLYELVYHDAIVTSWRWEDGNHHNPEIWWKKDLFNILYGSAPLWSIDQELWENYHVTFIESYKKICPWLQQICYDEMISHQFLTPDHKVQQSTFSSGKTVVVNFGETDYSCEGELVKARSFLIK